MDPKGLDKHRLAEVERSLAEHQRVSEALAERVSISLHAAQCIVWLQFFRNEPELAGDELFIRDMTTAIAHVDRWKTLGDEYRKAFNAKMDKRRKQREQRKQTEAGRN